MQSILGALLTAGYASAMATLIAGSPDASQITDSTQSTLTKSFSSAADLAQQTPQYSSQIISSARTSFLDGDQWAYTAGLVAVLLGAALVFFMFPRKEREMQLVAQYQEADTSPPTTPAATQDAERAHDVPEQRSSA